WGVYWLSSSSRTTLYLPPIPPRELTYLKYVSVPAVSGLPIAATGPGNGVMTPRWMVPAPGSTPGAATNVLAAWVPVVPPATVVVELLVLPPQAASSNAATPTTALGTR